METVLREEITGALPSIRLADFKALIARSVGWVVVARVISSVGGIVRYVLFARLLGPFDFGVFAAASFAEGFLRSLTDPSFSRAVVPQAGEIESYLDTIWLTMLVQGLTVALALIVAARPLASFFKIGDAYRVFIATAPMAMLISLQSPAASGRIARNLDFRILCQLDLADLMGTLIIGGIAVIWLGDWRGLIVAVTAGQAARAALTYWYFPYWPRMTLDFRKARELFRFGRWVTLRRLADFAAGNLDNLVVGHLLGAQPLGEYQFAFRLGGLPCSEVSLTSGVVIFPLMTRVGRDGAFQRRIFLLAIAVVVAVGVIYALLMSRWASLLLSFTVGKHWLDALGPLKLLCWYGCGRGVIVVGTHVLDGLNKPAYSFSITLTSIVLLAAFIYPLTAALGTVGAAWAALISVAIPSAVMFRLYHKVSGESV